MAFRSNPTATLTASQSAIDCHSTVRMHVLLSTATPQVRCHQSPGRAPPARRFHLNLNEDSQPFQRQYTGEIVRIQELLDAYEVSRDTDVTGEDLRKEKRPSNTPQIMDTIGSRSAAPSRSCVGNLPSTELKQQLAELQDAIRCVHLVDLCLSATMLATACCNRSTRSWQLERGAGAVAAPGGGAGAAVCADGAVWRDEGAAAGDGGDGRAAEQGA